MKKILFILGICFLPLVSDASTRYVVVNNTIEILIERYDSLGNELPLETINTRGGNFYKDFGDYSISAFSFPVSDEESKAIKKAKNIRGWAIAGVISNAVSAGLNAGQVGHRGFRGFYHHVNMHLDLHNMRVSAELANKWGEKLRELNNNTGRVVMFTNHTMKPITFFNDKMPTVILPKDATPLTITGDGYCKFTFTNSDGSLTKIKVKIIRETQKITYRFKLGNKYFMYKNKKGPLKTHVYIFDEETGTEENCTDEFYDMMLESYESNQE